MPICHYRIDLPLWFGFEFDLPLFTFTLPSPTCLLVPGRSWVQVSSLCLLFFSTERTVWQVPGRRGAGGGWSMAGCHGYSLYLHFAHIQLLIAYIAYNWQLPSIWILLIDMLSSNKLLDGASDVTHLSPSLVISVRLPIVSGISGISLCWRSSDVIWTQFPISANTKEF